MTPIPLVNLKKQYASIKKEVDPEVMRIFGEGSFVLGKDVPEFEEAFVKFTGAKFCVGVGSGRDALLLSMRALGIGAGDEVITVPNTFIATVFPIVELGAKPVFVDINPDTYQIDLKKLEKAITKKTKAIVPVHLFGIVGDMPSLMKVAKKHKLLVIEDACQAHGSRFKGRHAGTFGDAAAFSFYPGKNLGAPGEMGAVITDKRLLYEKLKVMRDVGQSKKYYHTMFGYNSRPDTIHSAVLKVKLRKLEGWNEKRRKVAIMYRKLLSDLPVVLPPEMDSDSLFNYHLFVIRVSKRDELLEFLKSKEVFCGIHYPVPVHLQKAVKALKYKRGSFPITEKYAKEIISLPIFPEMEKEEVERVSALIHEFYKK
jgi:dTDP-4-amino-4,6-dideoxygalactose transaminase